MKFISQSPTVTINDVASKAGVSVGTVSRVLNGASNITQANLDRVLKVIAELGYQKNRSGELLASRRGGSRVQTGNIGLVFAEMGGAWANHPMVASYTFGVERVCNEKGFHALVEFYDFESARLPRCVRDNKIDGLLIKTTRQLPVFVKEIAAQMPVVCVGFNDPSIAIQQVAPDDRGAGWMVADYLWSLGHRRIGFVCNDMMHPMFLSRLQGYEGFLRLRHSYDETLCALSELDIERTVPEIEPPNLDALLKKILSAPRERVTAIVTANDWMAHGLYSALTKAGLRVPDDISVVGFDNAIAVCTGLAPQLTSFAIPFEEMAGAGAFSLLDQIENPERKRDHSLELIRGEMVVRGSARALSFL